jgi:hypothetical protein
LEKVIVQVDGIRRSTTVYFAADKIQAMIFGPFSLFCQNILVSVHWVLAVLGGYLEYGIGDRCDNFRPETDKMGEMFSGNLLIQKVKGFSRM